MIAHAAETLWDGEALEHLGAAVDGLLGNAAGRAVGDKVAGNEEEVGGEGVDALDGVVQVERLGELIEVDIGELENAKAVEGVGQAGKMEGALGELEVVAGVLAGVAGHDDGGSDGGLQKAAAGKVGRALRLQRKGVQRVHGSLYRLGGGRVPGGYRLEWLGWISRDDSGA